MALFYSTRLPPRRPGFDSQPGHAVSPWASSLGGNDLGLFIVFFKLKFFYYLSLAVFRNADPGCLSRILIFTYPGSPISDPGSRIQNKREVWHKICCHTFFVATNSKKFKLFYFWNAEEFLKNYRTFVTKLSKIWVWDPGSEIRDPEKTYSGSRIRVQASKRHRIPDPNPQHWSLGFLERGPSYRRSLDPSTKVNIQYFFTTFALLDPDPHSR